MTITKSLCTYLTYKTKNDWCSIDAYFHAIVALSLLAFLRINVANTSIMHQRNQVAY